MTQTLSRSSFAASLILCGVAFFPAPHAAGQTTPSPKDWTTAEDHRNMMEQLGIKALRQVLAATKRPESCEL